MSAPAAARSAARNRRTPLAGTISAPAAKSTAGTAASAAAQVASDTARNQANNSLANTGHGCDLDRRAGQHRRRDHGPAFRDRPLPARQYAARGQSPGPVRRHDDLVQPGARRVAEPGAAGDRPGDAAASACRRRSTAAFRAPPQVFQQSLANEPILIAAALLAVYIVLGVLYESYVHPITILSTLALGRGRRGAGADR